MGILNDLLSEQSVKTIESKRDQILTEGVNIYETRYKSKYPKFGEMFESTDPREQYRAAVTAIVMRNQEDWVSGNKAVFGEATVLGSLGALTPKILDVVRIFYPNQVAHLLTDIQPLSQQTGDIFVIKPKYTHSGAGVSAGSEVFKTMTDGTYADEVLTASLGTANGTLVTFGGSLVTPVRRGTVKISRAGASTSPVATDNSSGSITGTDGGATISGTVNYETGVLSITYSSAPASGAITASYRTDSEQNVSQIRELEIGLDLVPVRAYPHPLKVKWSVSAALAAGAHLGLDVPDTLTNLAAQFIKVERDTLIISAINNAATADPNLNFDAAPAAEYPRWQKYQEIELKLNYAESAIQAANGRGGVSWVLCGFNASDIWRKVAGFKSEPVIAPIGAHKIGTLRDGTVDVIKSPALDTNTYIVGYKGYMPGDSATILAEWIPLYFTPVWNSPDLQGHRGVMSMYDMFVNVGTYYRKGTVSNYTA